MGGEKCRYWGTDDLMMIGSTFRIMFDGFKAPTSLHGTYIEPMTVEEQPAACTGDKSSG
jgi:hypothetical protein